MIHGRSSGKGMENQGRLTILLLRLTPYKKIPSEINMLWYDKFSFEKYKGCCSSLAHRSPFLYSTSFFFFAVKMADFSRLSLLVCLSFSFRVFGGIVSRDLHIVNANLSPDGFTRSYVAFLVLESSLTELSSRTVVAEGTFPGPLIQGFKGDNFRVCCFWHRKCLCLKFHATDQCHRPTH